MRCRDLILAVLLAFWRELRLGPTRIRQHGLSYFVKHLLCTVYLTYRVRRERVRFPEPGIPAEGYTPISAGLVYPLNEWEQERPMPLDQLKKKEDIHIFEGSHSESGSWLLIRLSRLQEGLCQAFVVLQPNKGANVLSVQNEVRLDLSDATSYNGCGLKLECLAPMRRWRVAFNGLMTDQTGKDVHVKIGAIWSAASHVFEYPQQVSVQAVADSLSHLNPFTMLAQVESTCKDEFAYSQAGHMDAQITVDGGDPEEFHLWGSRMHFAGRLEPRRVVHRFMTFRRGHRLHLILRKVEGQQVVMGSMFDPSRKIRPIIVSEDVGDRILVETERQAYSVRFHEPTLAPISLATSDPRLNDEFVVCEQEATLDNDPGISVTMTAIRQNRPRLALPKEYEHVQVDSRKKVPDLVLSLFEADCKRQDLAGGKGASLAVLTSISRQFRNFTVPRGVVLTTNAYEKFFEQPSVRSAVEQLTCVILANPSTEALKKACERCVSAVEKAAIPAEVDLDLKARMIEVMGQATENRRVAVRSSAVGEDSEEMSAAGQMKTILSVPAADSGRLAEAISQCWASQFSFVAINYKRQHGQPVAVPMAIVVQDMVPAEAAGVMFTCDPVTSNSRVITVTANYGLGESVVSGSSEPDTFTVTRTRDGKVSLKEVRIGKKHGAVQENADGSTEQVDVDEERAQRASISETNALRLASIGHEVETCFTNARDIEWAIVGEQLYLLQNRPVTSTMKESEFETANDCNGAIASEAELLTKATVAEIFPGAVSVLGEAIITGAFGVLAQEYLAYIKPSDDHSTSLYRNLVLPLLRKQIFASGSDRDFDSLMGKAFMYASYGKDISGEELFKKRVLRKPPPRSLPDKLRGLVTFGKMLLETSSLIKDAAELSKSFEVYQNDKLTAEQQLRHILQAITACKPFSMALFEGFINTAIYDGCVMNILARANGGEIDADVLTATAQLLQAGEIESVNVPLSLQRLGASLSKCADREQFLKMSPDDALRWLKSATTEEAKRFRVFLKKHGHRCVKEMDVFVKPWAMEPTKLVRTLQMAASVQHDPKQESKHDFNLSDLGKIKLSFLQKQMLNFFVPRARRAVANREIAKSALCRAIHKIRLAIYRLADLMVCEGRLPHRELVFFLNFDEICRLIATRSPSIVARATRRYRQHPMLDEERYPLLQLGFPKKIAPRVPLINAVLEAKGTPVCEGIVEGPVRVVMHFDKEAHLIQKGDILITTATDTGWTPYFPILGGVVTEIGGLVSHGAVVAREYGLPCVVGVEDATHIFKSGDVVRLDGRRGTLQKIEIQKEK